MSSSITTSFVKQFEDDVHDAFQRRGSFLLQTVRRKNDVKGATTTFQKIGKGAATTKARHGQITPMNQDHTAIECTLADFYAGDWVDDLDEAKIGHDERRAIADGGAWALGRKSDEQIITAMDATLSTITAGAMTRAKLLGWAEALDDTDVPNDGHRWGLLTPRAWSIAMTIEEFASGDFVGDQPFMKGANPRTWLGIHWMMHTGLTGKGTATANCFAFHRNAVGYGAAREIDTTVQFHNDRDAWFVNNKMSGGACLIDGTGVIKLAHDDTQAIPSA